MQSLEYIMVGLLLREGSRHQLCTALITSVSLIPARDPQGGSVRKQEKGD